MKDGLMSIALAHLLLKLQPLELKCGSLPED